MKKKRGYVVGRDYPWGDNSNIKVRCVRVEDEDKLPDSMMEKIYLRAHNMKQAKALFLLSGRFATKMDLDIGPLPTTRHKRGPRT